MIGVEAIRSKLSQSHMYIDKYVLKYLLSKNGTNKYKSLSEIIFNNI